ncbi:MAG TPA: ABC transporter substrate-binding protein [Candidatus Saccharimonadales bacterium]|nr:ABC transporter substrate-binding protein [Candidatus Saccharimonadales bacterium]
MTLRISVLRGVCQIPIYVAHDRGFLEREGVASELVVESTAWLAPSRLHSGDTQFAVIPWTRVAASSGSEAPLVLVCGSGCEEAAIVVRRGLDPREVRRVAVPVRGGMKDLTAMGLLESLGWQGAELVRMPSGDGAIVALFGQGVDAASMVEPYATMLEELGVGTVVRRTGDVWKGAPGCSLCTTRRLRDQDPELVQRVVRAHVRAARYADEHRAESAEVAARYIGVSPRFILAALERNRPDMDAIRNQEAMERILALMTRLGYLPQPPSDYADLRFLDRAAEK